MTRNDAVKFAYSEIQKFPELKDWKVRVNTSSNIQYVGYCDTKHKCIILNAAHCDIHPDEEVKDTILHEIAHALTPNHSHDIVWQAKAKELGARPSTHCALELPSAVINALRSGADIEFELQEEIIRRPIYKVTRIQEKCEKCGKVAVTKSEHKIEQKDQDHDLSITHLECGHVIIKKLKKATPFHTLTDVKTCADGTQNHAWIGNTCDKCGGHKPFNFQMDGMRFGELALTVNNGVGIFDEMGLGKTIQALGIVKFNPELWPVLYVVKSGIKFQWFKQILTWTHDEHICQVIEKSTDIIIPGLKGYIISYDLVVPKVKKMKSGKIVNQGFDIEKIINSDIKTIVFDECQQIKNPDSSRTQQWRKAAKGRKVIGLSGTPWKNRGEEFFSILNMIAPMKFSNFQRYLDTWVDYYEDANGNRKQGGIRNISRFKEYIKDIAIRRERADKDIKEETGILDHAQRQKLYIKMDSETDQLYNEAVAKFVEWYESERESCSSMEILGKLARLRHLVALAKVPATLEYVDEYVENHDTPKLVIFAHHQDVQATLINSLKEKYGSEMYVSAITSDLSGVERFEIQEKFNAAPKALLIASQLAAGEGLNLQTCADCIMHERQWNPANEEQAEGRFLRIGQKASEVTAVYTQASDSVDEHIDGIVERKRVQFHAAMNKGEAPVWSESEIVKEMAEIITRNYYNKQRAA